MDRQNKEIKEFKIGDAISCRDLDYLIATLKTLVACGYMVTADIDEGIIFIRGKHE